MSTGTNGIGLELESLTITHWVALMLVATTGVVHLYLYTTEGFLPFLLGGLGYLGAIGLFLFNVRRRILYLVGILFAALHIVGWISAGMPDGGWALSAFPMVNLGTLNKLVEIVLVGLLGYLYRRESAATVPTSQQQFGD